MSEGKKPAKQTPLTENPYGITKFETLQYDAITAGYTAEGYCSLHLKIGDKIVTIDIQPHFTKTIADNLLAAHELLMKRAN